jgi:hypothetical protein
MECQFGMGKARKGARELMPGDGSQDGIMSPARINEIYFTLADLHGSLSLNKMTVKSGSITFFKTT